MATTTKKTSKANNEKNNVVLSSVTFAAAKEYKQNQNLSFSATIKNLCAPYAPANKPFSTDILKQYSIENDSSINCFRAILLDEGGKYKIYRALDKYTTTKGTAAKNHKIFAEFVSKHEFLKNFEEVKTILGKLNAAAAAELAAAELAKKEREQKKENARIERITKGIESEDAAAAKIEELKKQIAALQNMQF